MGRSLRVEYVGAMYHVINRGNARGEIYWDDKDYDYFKWWMGKVCEKAGWKVHAWTLMPNHYHLLIETRRKTLIKGMQLLNSEYTRYFNRRHKKSGPLFQGRYKATLVEGKRGYLQTAADYIHLNFARARMTETMEELVKHPETSVGCYVRGKFPEWMEWRKVMGSLGQEEIKSKNRQIFYRHLERKSKDLMKEEGEWEKFRRIWCWGSEKLVERFERAMVMLRGKSPATEIWQRGVATQTEEVKAEECLGSWEKKRGQCANKLAVLQKYGLALWLREESMVSVKWLTQRLEMKSDNALMRGMSMLRKENEMRIKIQRQLKINNK